MFQALLRPYKFLQPPKQGRNISIQKSKEENDILAALKSIFQINITIIEKLNSKFWINLYRNWNRWHPNWPGTFSKGNFNDKMLTIILVSLESGTKAKCSPLDNNNWRMLSKGTDILLFPTSTNMSSCIYLQIIHAIGGSHIPEINRQQREKILSCLAT